MKDAVLAQLAGLSEKTIQRWVKNDAKDKVSETSHKKICTALEVQEYFFNTQDDPLTSLLKEQWTALSTVLPDGLLFAGFDSGLTNNAGDDVFNGLCQDLREHHGSSRLTPGLQHIVPKIQTIEQLDAIERFFGLAILLLVDPQHRVRINVDASTPVKVIGVESDWSLHMLINCQLSIDDRSVEFSFDANTRTVESPQNAHRIAKPVSAEQDDDEVCLGNATRLAKKIRPGEVASLEHSSQAKQKKAFARIDASILQTNNARNHVYAVASNDIPTRVSETLKSRFLPALRVFQLQEDDICDVFYCDEVNVEALICESLASFAQRRAEFEPELLNPEQEKRVKNSNPGISVVNSPNTVIANDGSTQSVAQQNNTNRESSQIRQILKELSGDLFKEGHADLAKDARDIAGSDDEKSLKGKVANFFDKAKKISELPQSILNTINSLSTFLS